MKIFSAVLRPFLGLIIFGASFSVSSAFAEGCTPIVSVPIEIKTPGTYCLTGDLEYLSPYPAVPAVFIKTDDVTLDFKGYEIRGVSNLSKTGVQVYTNYLGANNIVIRNGKITGVGSGISINAKNSIVENMIISDVDGGRGINVHGNDVLIRNNVITNISISNSGSAYGIYLGLCTQGTGFVTVLGNVISGVKHNENRTAAGIYAGACRAVIEENHISSAQGGAYGILVPGAGSGFSLVVGNRFSGGMNTAIHCQGTGVSVRFKDNLAIRNWAYAGRYDCHENGDLGGNF